MVLPLIIRSLQSTTKPGVGNIKMERARPSLIADPNFLGIVIFSLITLNLMLRFPDLGGMIAQYNQF